MLKKPLESLELLKFPSTMCLSRLKSERIPEYLFCAKKIMINRISFLQVDFHSIELGKVEFRVFFSKNDFLTQMLLPEIKWSNRMLDKFNWNMEVFIPVNNKSSQVIHSFFKKRLDNYLESMKPALLLHKFQEKVRSDTLKKNHDRIKNRIDDELSFIKKLPSDLGSWVEQYPLDSKQYIFYKRRNKKIIDGYCIRCKKAVSLDYARHNEKGTCPNCNGAITFKAQGRVKTLLDEFVFTYAQKADNNAIALRVFEGFRSFRDGYLQPKIHYSEKRRYILDDNKKLKCYHYGLFKGIEYRWCEGEQRTGLYSNYYTDTGCLYHKNSKKVFNNTIYQYLKITELAESGTEFDVIDYISFALKDSGILYLIEHQMYHLTAYVACMGYSSKICTKALTQLKKYKEFMSLFKEIQITYDVLKFLDKLPSRKYIKRELLLFIQNGNLSDDFHKIMYYTTPIKAMNYLIKKKNGKHSYLDLLILWLDYLNCAKKLNYDVSAGIILFPRDLIKAHDELNYEEITRCETKDDAAINQMAVEADKIYRYKSKRFFIRHPLTSKEIKDEGAKLGHCVGGYVGKVVSGKTTILLLRKIDEPLRPFYTIEYIGNKVRQIYGKSNRNPTPEISAFIEQWKRYLKRNQMKEAQQQDLLIAA